MTDPDTQVSYIYYTSQGQLRERIGRIQVAVAVADVKIDEPAARN